MPLQKRFAVESGYVLKTEELVVRRVKTLKGEMSHFIKRGVILTAFWLLILVTEPFWGALLDQGMKENPLLTLLILGLVIFVVSYDWSGTS